MEDHWSLECFGRRFRPLLEFNVTAHRGFVVGYTKLFPGQVFPNTIVDFQENKTSGVYDWVIELQCVERLHHVWFVGVNFYSRNNRVTQAQWDVMMDAAKARGIDSYMSAGLGLYHVPQVNCSYDPPPTLAGHVPVSVAVR